MVQTVCHLNNFPKQLRVLNFQKNALSVCWGSIPMSTHYLFVCESVHTVYYTVQNVAQSCTSVLQKSARMLTWQMSILLTLVLSLVLLDPVLGDDQAPRLSVYPPVPGLEPSPYYGLRVREVS